eukprot:XP_011669930.1 PREDICTED: uncharacterized protein LOC100890617 [Strongylocentrotus purpuratus]
MASPIPKKRERKANFSTEEQYAMVTFVSQNTQALFGKAGFCGKRVEERKQKAWEQCEALLRAAGGCQREWKDVRKKWQELKTRALACRSKSKMTGGGPAPHMTVVFERVLEVLAPQCKDGICGSEDVAGVDDSQEFPEIDPEIDIDLLAGAIQDADDEAGSSDRVMRAGPSVFIPPSTPLPSITLPQEPQEPPPHQHPGCLPCQSHQNKMLETISSQLEIIISLLKKKEE